MNASLDRARPRAALRGALPVFVLCLLGGLPARAAAQDPFRISAGLEVAGEIAVVSLALDIEPGHFLYADQLEVKGLDGVSLVPEDVPPPVRKFDTFSQTEREIYQGSFEALYRVEGWKGGQVRVRVGFQGCSEELCFLPETKTFALGSGPASMVEAAEPVEGGLAPAADWREWAGRFRVAGRESGYMGRAAFLSFLDSAEQTGASTEAGQAGLEGMALGSALLLILLGGLALNLTPCVLPMIPINLAIIGAGAQAGSRRRGLALGAAYGGAIALTYGVLGAVVVVTGATFGALNSSPWFNAGVAVVFVVLALAMFGVIHIDFTRLQSRFGPSPRESKGSYITAFGVGTLAALLAGACVAPVVISVLVWAGNLYAAGTPAGLLLPFLLGLGMGLPWPFAGAGLSFLPKPGAWMSWVKNGFGVLILGLALYYGHLAYGLFRTTPIRGTRDTPAGEAFAAADKVNRELAARLEDAYAQQRPVLIDFWASWCKNCVAMDKTTFLDPEVQRRLGAYLFAKYAAEQPREPATQQVLDYFGVIGLPTYVVLTP